MFSSAFSETLRDPICCSILHDNFSCVFTIHIRSIWTAFRNEALSHERSTVWRINILQRIILISYIQRNPQYMYCDMIDILCRHLVSTGYYVSQMNIFPTGAPYILVTISFLCLHFRKQNASWIEIHPARYVQTSSALCKCATKIQHVEKGGFSHCGT